MHTALPKRLGRPGPSRRFFSDELHRHAWPGFLAIRGLRISVIGMFLLVTLLIDYATGPTIRFPAFYALPILLVAWYQGFWPGLFCGLFVVGARLIMEVYLWAPIPWPMEDSLINAAAGLPMIALLVWFTALAGRLSREVRVLWGLVPICMYCHQIRDEKNIWWKLEAYLEDRTQAAFTHGVCPTCLKARVQPA